MSFSTQTNLQVNNDEISHNTPQNEKETDLNIVLPNTTTAFSFHNDDCIKNNLLKLCKIWELPTKHLKNY